MAPKLTKNSEAVKTLTSWFKSGKLGEKDQASDVQKAHDLFRPYRQATFRTKFITLRKQYCNPVDNHENKEDDVDELDRHCSFKDTGGSRKRRLIESAIESDEDFEDVVGSGFGLELVSDNLSFKPLSLLSIWKEPHTMTKRISAAIVLPSGIGVGEFSLRVVDSGEFLELTVVWPSPLLEMDVMHKKWLGGKRDGIELYHPKFVGFQQSLSMLRSKTSDAVQPVARINLPFRVQTSIKKWLGGKRDGIELYHPKFVGFQQSLSMLRSKTSDAVQPVARINLPFRVQTSIDNKFDLAWGNNITRMLYVDLKAVVEDYAIVNDSQSFEVL